MAKKDDKKPDLIQQTLFPVSDIDAQKSDAVFTTMRDKYGAWPTTVLEVDHQDRLAKDAAALIGDSGDVRAASATSIKYKTEMGSSDNNVSIFSPLACQWILNMFGHKAPATGKVCYDPFAGGGTRAVLTAKHGYRYMGMEIRPEEVQAVQARCAKNKVSDLTSIIYGDAASPPIEDSVADFILTCPPYFDMEKYDGGGSDLSMATTYQGFVNMMRTVVNEATRIAKRKCTAVWVVGMHRREDGWLLPLHHDLTRLHLDAGWRLDEEIVLYHKNNGAIQRVGMFEKGKGHMVRLHEYVMVYQLNT